MKDTVIGLNAASSASANHNVNQSKLLLQQSTDLSTISGRVEHVQTSIDTIQDAVTSMNERMEQISQESLAQKEDIRTLFLTLKNQISGLANQHTDWKHPSHSESIHTLDSSNGTKDDSALFESIKRLGIIASEKEGNICDKEADSFVDHLENILQAMIGPLNSRHTASSKREFDTLGELEDITVREMKRICHMVASSQGVSLNTGSKLHLILPLINPLIIHPSAPL